MLILYLFSLHRTDLASLRVASLVSWVSRITRIQMPKYIKLGNARCTSQDLPDLLDSIKVGHSTIEILACGSVAPGRESVPRTCDGKMIEKGQCYNGQVHTQRRIGSY
jgi:hypothetical protein